MLEVNPSRSAVLSSETSLAARVALLLLQVGALVSFACPGRVGHGFPIDDAWIHQDVARSFAATGTLGYDGVRFGSGATSYLWAALLALNFRFVHMDPVVYTFALNVALYLCAGQLLLTLALREGARARSGQPGALAAAEAVGLVALACLGGNYIWFAYSGMEATLLVALSLGAIVCVSPVPSPWPRASASCAGIACGLLALTRPETIALGPLLAVASRFFGWNWRRTALLLAPWALAVAVYLGVNALLSGTMLPATLGGRKWIWLGDYTGLPRGYMLWDFVCMWIVRLRNYTLGTSSDVALWLSFGLAVVALVQWIRARCWGLLLASTWALIHVVIYAILLPTMGHGGRYQPLLPLTYLFMVGAGSIALLDGVHAEIARLLKRDWPYVAGAVALPLALAPWVGLVAVGVRDWRTDNGKAVTHINATEIGMGALIDRLPARARVASFDIGGIGFASHRPILDLGGLSDAATARMLANGTIWEYLRDQRVDYVVIPEEYDANFPGALNFALRLHLRHNPALRLTLMRTLETPPHLWLPAINATAGSAPRQALYRVEFTGQPGPTGASGLGTPLAAVDPSGFLDGRARAILARELAVLAGVGVRASVALVPDRETPTAAPDAAWRVSIGAWGVRVQPPSDGAGVGERFATARMLDRLEPYLNSRDFAGAALLVPHVLGEIIEQEGDPTFDVILPTVPFPGATTDSQRVLDALPVGLTLAAAVCGAAFWLDRRLRGASPGRVFRGAASERTARGMNADAA